MMAYQMLTIQNFIFNYELEDQSVEFLQCEEDKRNMCETGVDKFIQIGVCYFIKQSQMVEVSQKLYVLQLNSVL